MTSTDCGEAGCSEGCCGNASCLPSNNVRRTAEQESRAMFVARLENMQKNGECWLTVIAVLALLNDCDMLATRTPRCASCNYEHGHAIGYKNNPVDIALKEQHRRDAFDSLPDDYEVN